VSPFTRDDHLSDLGLEMWVAGELSAADEARVQGHLSACEPCRLRVEAVAHTPLVPARPTVAEPVPANRPWGWAALGVAAVAAVLLAVFLGGGPGRVDGERPGDGYRLKGSGLSLQVVRATAEGAEPLSTGDSIRAGDRLGFVVGSTRPGHLVVLAVDAGGQVDVCYPPGGDAPAAVEAGPALPLDAAVRADDSPGDQRFVALRCDQGFSLASARAVAVGGALPDGCAREEVVLSKERP